ncbi:MAG: 5'/3'-nucleotidase SurE [Parachlamydiales bacterium]|nr:5'/3'-nucleotidase SurE [Parachlamydiales bacterium]
MKNPYILITNDDGIHAPGILTLSTSLKKAEYEFAIVAPSSEKSGAGVSTSINKPLHIHPFPWQDKIPAWSVNGTPADCVKMAISVILKKKPDLILSGINRGANSGRNIFYSGTVGGIIEGTLRQIPGIAFSIDDFYEPSYEKLEKYIHPIIQYFLNNPLPIGTLVNVTFPQSSLEIKGFRMVRHGQGYLTENPVQRIHPEGRHYYWLGGKWADVVEEEDTDIALLKQGYITVVPIQINELTDHKILQQHKDPFEETFKKIS